MKEINDINQNVEQVCEPSSNEKLNEIKSQSDKMRKMPIGKLLFVMSVPAILSMLVQALYNVVDTLFIAGYSEQVYASSAGTTAISAVMPIQFLIIGVAVGLGVGTNVAIATKLGEGNKKVASQIARHGLLMALCACVVFFVLAFVICEPFMQIFCDGDELVKQLGIDYISICLFLSFGVFIEVMLSKILQSTGSMKIPMVSQLIGAVTNIVLDPLLIYGIGIFPELGVTGAAVATVTGQITAMCFMVSMYVFKKHEVSVNLLKIKFNKKHIFRIAVVGLPTLVMNMSMSIMIALLNVVLIVYQNGIAILGIFFKVQSFIFMPVYGLMQGLMPILSYNYGSNNKKRYMHAYRLAVIIALIIMIAGFVAFLLLGEIIMKIFSASGDYMTNGAYALRVMAIAFVFAGIGITLSTALQSVGMGMLSLLVSFMRQVILVVPIALLMSYLFGFSGVWFGYPIAEFITSIIFLPIGLHYINKRFRRLDSEKLLKTPATA